MNRGPERLASPWRALATDYDGTLAEGGRVPVETLAALGRWKASGRLLILVTGRQLDDLLGVFPHAGLCDLVVAENGALLYAPAAQSVRSLAPPPPQELVRELRRRGVGHARGRTVIATDQSQAAEVEAAAHALGLSVELALNKGALMVLPPGVDKRSGLLAALEELRLPAEEVVGVGDAENDVPLLQLCGCAVAVANALPAVKEAAGVVTAGARGEGVRELIDSLLRREPCPMSNSERS